MEFNDFIFNNKQIKGIEADLLNLISKKMDLSYNIIEKPNDSIILDNIKTNNIHFEFNYSKDNVDLSKTIYSKPILSIPMAIATTHDKKLIIDLSILKGKKIAVLKNSNIKKS